jgi:hypothetical protein
MGVRVTNGRISEWQDDYELAVVCELLLFAACTEV